MKPNKKYLSFYYEDLTEVPDFYIDPQKTALLIVDMQKHFLLKDGEDAEGHKKNGTWDKWKAYFDHVENVTIPNNKRLMEACRRHGIEVTYGRICSLKADGKDRARVQSTIGWNNILVPIDTPNAAMVDELSPLPGDNDRFCQPWYQLYPASPEYGDRYGDCDRCCNRSVCGRYDPRTCRSGVPHLLSRRLLCCWNKGTARTGAAHYERYLLHSLRDGRACKLY